jgi:hypothetical protein
VTPAVTLRDVGRPDGSAPGTVPAVPPIWAVTAAVNAAAAIALATVLAPGVSLTYGPDNAAYVGAHLLLWRAGWALWITAAVSLLAFFVWWAARAGWTGVARVAVAIATVGVVADVTAEARLFAWSADVDVGAALRQSGVVANACYSVAGALLMLATPRLPRRLALWGWLVWALGAGLSIAAAASSDIGSEVLTAALFVLFIPWLVVLGRRLS